MTLPRSRLYLAALVNKFIETEEEFCTFDIAHEAIKLHFQNKIGYVTLIKTMHEKFHNGKLGIPMNLIKGDYRYFINTFKKYIDETDMETIEDRLATTEHNCSWSKDNYPVAAEM